MRLTLLMPTSFLTFNAFANDPNGEKLRYLHTLAEGADGKEVCYTITITSQSAPDVRGHFCLRKVKK